MTEIQKSYLAGLFDGEGYFCIEKDGTGLRPIIGIDMTCEKTIKLVKELVGYGYVSKKSTNPIHKDQWKWRVCYKNARLFANELLPYLVTKKDGAEKIINHTGLKTGAKPKHKT